MFLLTIPLCRVLACTYLIIMFIMLFRRVAVTVAT